MQLCGTRRSPCLQLCALVCVEISQGGRGGGGGGGKAAGPTSSDRSPFQPQRSHGEEVSALGAPCFPRAPGAVVRAPDLPLTDGCAGREGARSEQPSLLPYCWPSGAIWGNAISHALPSSCQARGVQTKQPESGTFLPEFHGKPVPIQIFRVVSQNRGRRGRREVPINSLVHVT